jgi:4-carboxymuconolactone decarboxylase
VSNDEFEQGLQIRREVIGAEYVDAAFTRAEAAGFGDFQRLVTEYCWGAAWGRPTLTRRDRSLLNVVMLGALNRAEEFELHLRAAIRNGCTKDEIQDALIQLTIYAGVPAGVEAFRIALKVYDDVSPTTAESG